MADSANFDVGLLALELTAGGADDEQAVSAAESGGPPRSKKFAVEEDEESKLAAAEEGNLEVWGLEYVEEADERREIFFVRISIEVIAKEKEKCIIKLRGHR